MRGTYSVPAVWQRGTDVVNEETPEQVLMPSGSLVQHDRGARLWVFVSCSTKLQEVA